MIVEYALINSLRGIWMKYYVKIVSYLKRNFKEFKTVYQRLKVSENSMYVYYRSYHLVKNTVKIWLMKFQFWWELINKNDCLMFIICMYKYNYLIILYVIYIIFKTDE